MLGQSNNGGAYPKWGFYTSDNATNDPFKLHFVCYTGNTTEGDLGLMTEVENELNAFSKLIKDFELKLILNGDNDINDAIITIHPGAGGTESQDWAEMLYRMYSMWSESKGFKFNVIDFQNGDEAGLKDCTVEISGDYAYGLLQAEIGIHRLVRISPFDSNSRRHTSFASVSVSPAVNEDIDI